MSEDSTTPTNFHQAQFAERERAVSEMQARADRGEGLSAQSYGNLSSHHLVSLASNGDDYTRYMAYKAMSNDSERER